MPSQVFAASPEPLVSDLAGVHQLQHRLGAVEVGLRTQLTLLSADRDRLRSLTQVRWVTGGDYSTFESEIA